MKLNSNILMLPQYFLQIYLIITLVIFALGPVNYNISQPFTFWGFIALYHISFFLGYKVALLTFKNKDTKKSGKKISENFSIYYFYLILFLALISSVFSFKGIDSIFNLFNPLFWVESAINGILNPGEVYLEKMERVYSESAGNKLLNFALFFISFSKLMLLPFLVFFWRRISLKLRFISLFIVLLPLMSSLSNGTNKGIFDFVLLSLSSLFIVFIYNKFQFGKFSFHSRKFFLGLFLVSFLGGLTFFGNSMDQRGGSIDYIETVDNQGRIEVNENKNDNFIYFTYAWLSTYIVQGYYGFSLSLEEDFESTYGVGNSIFLTRNFESLLGVEIFERTYQNKISKYWDKDAQWHSFYSYFANDFHFFGVAFICFLLSFMLARVWINFLCTGNIFAGTLICIFFIMIIFIPANNQIFGFLDGLSAFLITSFLWRITNQNKIRYSK